LELVVLDVFAESRRLDRIRIENIIIEFNLDAKVIIFI